jgi:hypothetical protein
MCSYEPLHMPFFSLSFLLVLHAPTVYIIDPTHPISYSSLQVLTSQRLFHDYSFPFASIKVASINLVTTDLYQSVQNLVVPPLE